MSWFWRASRTRSTSRARSRPCRLNVEPLESRHLLSGNAFGRGPIANVTYHGGPLLTNAQVESVYYGQSWSTDTSLQQQIQQVDGFLQYFVTSPYMAVLKQYNVGNGSYLNDVVLPQNPPNGQTIDDTQIQQILNSEITGNQLAAPNANSLYVFFAAPGVTVTANGQNSINNFAGYHSTFTDSAGAPIYYAVIPYPTGNVSSLQLTTVQQDTLILSHELAEAITDPDTQTGWFDPQQGEIGDIAEGQTGVLGGYVVQGVWSQAAGQVVIPSDTSGTSLTVNGETIQGTADQALTSIVGVLTGTSAGTTAGSFTATISWGDGNTSTGTITADPNGGFDITGTNTYTQAGSYPITVTVKDLTGKVVATGMSQANIAAPVSPVTAKGAQISATASQSFTGMVATFTDSNSQATASSFTVTIDWGDGTTSSGTVTADPKGGFDVSGTHTYTSSSDQGSGFPFGGWDSFGSGQGGYGDQYFVVTVTIHDNLANASTVVESMANVAPAPPAISVTGKNVQATSGVSFQGVVATFTSTDAKATASTFTATINWGDGTTSTGTVTADPNGGFDATGTHTYTLSSGWNSWWGFGFGWGNQRFDIQVSITDTQTQDQGTGRSEATVAPTPPNLAVTAQNLQATEGQAFNGVVATFTDVNTNLTASNFTATINWGDGATSTGTITADPKGGFDVSGTHTYANSDSWSAGWGNWGFGFGQGGYSFGLGDQVFLLTVTVSSTVNSDAGSDKSVVTVQPPPANLQATGTQISAVSGTAFSGTVATFTSLDTNPTPSQFTATIDWGDGTTSTGTITANSGGGFTVAGTHTYTDSSSADVGSDWHHQGYQFGHHGRHSGHGDQLFVVTVTITDQTNNNTAEAVSLVSLAPAATSVSATTAGSTVGNPKGTSQNTNPSSGSTTNGGTTPVSQPTPTPVLSGLQLNSTATQTFSGSVATFSDADGAGAGSFTATIAWGDGQTTTGQIAASGNGTFSISGSHVYILAGNYSVSVVLTDADGTSASTTSTATVTAVQGKNSLPAQVSQVAIALTTSAEYYSNRIITAYQTYLSRGPDVSGLAYWISRMQQGLTDEQLEAGFIGSPEYIQNHGGTGAAWVVGMYQDILGRSPDAAGLSYWLQQLQQGVPASTIAYGFAASPEREAQRVTADYQQFLSRAPAQAEVNYWVNQFLSGKTNEQVIAGFVASQEDYQKHYNDARDWIFGAYQNILGRLPDPAGLNHWLSVLES
jgi:hypothetical protein